MLETTTIDPSRTMTTEVITAIAGSTYEPTDTSTTISTLTPTLTTVDNATAFSETSEILTVIKNLSFD